MGKKMDISTAHDNLRKNYAAIEAQRAAKRVKVIDYIKPVVCSKQRGAGGGTRTKRPMISEGCRCQATTLAGKKCPFRATCGMYCKKHQV